jgi:hypothetical protein
MKMVSDIIANILSPNSYFALFVVVRITVISIILGGNWSRPTGYLFHVHRPSMRRQLARGLGAELAVAARVRFLWIVRVAAARISQRAFGACLGLRVTHDC